MSKIQKLKVETLGTYSLMEKVNELVDQINQLEEKLKEHKYGNYKDVNPYDLSSQRRRNR